MNLIFLGSGAFGIPSLEALAGSDHKVLAVVTQPDRPAGRGKQLTPTPVAALAAKHAWPLLKPENVNAPEVLAQLAGFKADILVVIAFGQKLSDDLLRLTPHSGINLHSSLLPKYRGAAPINWAILNNDAVTGVSVIEITSVMDAGAILAVTSTPISASETAGELHDRLAQLGSPLLPQVLDQIAAGTVTRIPQDPAQVSKAPKLKREMAWIDFTQPAALVSAKIRGLSPWPGVQVELLDPTGKPRTTATLLKCQATVSAAPHAPEQCGQVLSDRTIACATGSIEIISLQPTGKKPMDLKAFSNGYGYDKGACLRSLQQSE